MEIPISFKWDNTLNILSTSINCCSVTSNSNLEVSNDVSAIFCWIFSKNTSLLNCIVDTLTANRQISIPDVYHSYICSQTLSITQLPTSTISPNSSKSGMNSTGDMRPNSG